MRALHSLHCTATYAKLKALTAPGSDRWSLRFSSGPCTALIQHKGHTSLYGRVKRRTVQWHDVMARQEWQCTLPVTMAWTKKPKLANMAKRPFLSSLTCRVQAAQLRSALTSCPCSCDARPARFNHQTRGATRWFRHTFSSAKVSGSSARPRGSK